MLLIIAEQKQIEEMLMERYCETDFDFAIVYLEEIHIFYIIPVGIFISYSSEIHLVESERRQRKPKSADYREAWYLLNNNLVNQQRIAEINF